MGMLPPQKKISKKFRMPTSYPYEGTPNNTFFNKEDGQRFFNNTQGTTDRRGVPYGTMQGLEVNNSSDPAGLDFYGKSFMSEDGIGQQYRESQNAGGYGGSPSFNLGKLGGGGDDKTDWLGWAGIGTGLLQGAGGIMDYFSNMKGLELTEQAMNRKYAADDRNYLAQATSLNNVIDTRRDYIDKTQGGRNTDFLKNIPVG